MRGVTVGYSAFTSLCCNFIGLLFAGAAKRDHTPLTYSQQQIRSFLVGFGRLYVTGNVKPPWSMLKSAQRKAKRKTRAFFMTNFPMVKLQDESAKGN